MGSINKVLDSKTLSDIRLMVYKPHGDVILTNDINIHGNPIWIATTQSSLYIIITLQR